MNITQEELGRLQKILSQTYKKNTEANANVNDLNQKTMQALDTLAAVYAVFGKAGGNLNVENFRRERSLRKCARRHGGVQRGPAQPRTHAGSAA